MYVYSVAIILPPVCCIKSNYSSTPIDAFNLTNVLLLLKKGPECDWRALGEALYLKMSNDFPNEFADMESEEQCLKAVVYKWVNYPESDWKSLAMALRKIGHDNLATEAMQKHLHVHCKSMSSRNFVLSSLHYISRPCTFNSLCILQVSRA